VDAPQLLDNFRDARMSVCSTLDQLLSHSAKAWLSLVTENLAL
jgi:hypothetical protein